MRRQGRVSAWTVVHGSVLPGVALRVDETAIVLPYGELDGVEEDLRQLLGDDVRLVEGYVFRPNDGA